MVGWLLVLYAGFSMLILGHSAWAAAIVPEYHQRSVVYGWMQAVGVLATITVLALQPVMATFWHKSVTEGVQAMGWFIIARHPDHDFPLHVRRRRTEAGRESRTRHACTTIG